jgi:D-arginine dehydrogenase
VVRAPAQRITEHAGRWHVITPAGTFASPVCINAAGGWGDRIAALAGARPLGLVPKRRTIVTFDGPPGLETDALPFVRSVADDFYFTGESGGILLSPADQTPVEPQDVQPDELDVAIAIDRYERVTPAEVRRIRAKWAGLRSFVADQLPVVGYDSVLPGFFWYIGQGGVGLQLSPMLSEAGARLVAHEEFPKALETHGVGVEVLSPARFA